MSEIYGTYTAFETARDKLKAHLDAMITAMATGYDPKLSYAYDSHHTIPILLNGVSIELIGVTRDSLGQMPGVIFNYYLDFSIRVHTNYIDRWHDPTKNARLLNSLDNYLSARLNLADGYRIFSITDHQTGLEFPESGTLGGQMKVTVKITIDHAQI
ncbi:MAG: hypothetical protein PHW53_04700 [Patescibacteria group bacterium]|nr:hypothetical protein [Patescibacteria group bacterium]